VTDRISQEDWELSKPIRQLGQMRPDEQAPDWCGCIHVDVDEWNARGCPIHGPSGALFRDQREREAADLIAYYSGSDPFEESLKNGDENRQFVPDEIVTQQECPNRGRTSKGESKMKEVLRFVIDSPVEVALRFETGKHVAGRYGDQVMYSLLDNRVMYVPPYVEQRIRELAIAAGEPLLLCKQGKTDGNRRWVEWSVRRAPQQPLPSPNETVAAGPAPGKTQNQRNGSTNGNANGASEKALVVMPNVISGAGITAMELALNGAAEIAQRVEGRAAAKSYSLRFSNEDIRAIALTIFIQAMREGGARWHQ
jgi:hypothetical protein